MSGWTAARNILCVRLDTIGDVLMTTPAIRALRTSGRGRRITLLTSSRGAAIAPLIPEIDETIVYDPPWMKATAGRPGAQPDLDMIEVLRARDFDAAAIFTVYSQNPLPSALACYLADIPLRLAYCRENPYQLLTDWVPETEPQEQVRHEAERHLDLVATVGAVASDRSYSLAVPHEDRFAVGEFLRVLGLDRTRPWCVVHPGASAESRRYPPEMYAAAARTLREKHGWQVVWTGDTSEIALVKAICDAMEAPCYSLAGRLTLGELATLIEAAPLLVSNNTAPVHIASAVGTAVVDLYALTNPQHTPWQVANRVLFHDVPCKFCYRSVCPEGHHACLRMVSPETVVAASLELMAERQGAGTAVAGSLA